MILAAALTVLVVQKHPTMPVEPLVLFESQCACWERATEVQRLFFADGFPLVGVDCRELPPETSPRPKPRPEGATR